jgi:hypothetical protein
MTTDRNTKVNLAKMLAAAERVAVAARNLAAARAALIREARRKANRQSKREAFHA